MRISRVWATLVASVLTLFTLVATARAQTQAGALAPKYGIAVVDISYVFKNHQRFKAMMEQMKTEVQSTETQLREQRKAIAKKEEQLGIYQAGSPDYKRLDEEITREKAEFNLQATKQRKDFLEKEAKIYYQAFVEVNDAVKYYAQRQNLGLVLRFNGDPIDPNKREDILRAINKPVVYQNSIDITPDILKTVNRSAGAAQPPINPGTSQIPGQPPRR